MTIRWRVLLKARLLIRLEIIILRKLHSQFIFYYSLSIKEDLRGLASICAFYSSGRSTVHADYTSAESVSSAKMIFLIADYS